ncbi:serine-rich adhesin for platelets-like [Branchiostoma floridae]|uniref:Serine-rich adhesin for platelets-like n=1 Tax=Branchiostoma floridae TaxID=7739 RepID=A0A9J7LW98_BRAFL|nr:serine-rich adhesin for platelets-like [Branchiostoma floridae]
MSTRIQKASGTTPSSKQEAKYVPKFGKKTKKKQEGVQVAVPKEEKHSNTTANVDGAQVASSGDSSPVQKEEDVTTLPAVLDEEKKTTSENGVATETTKVDTVETFSTGGTSLTNNLVQKQEDVTTLPAVFDEEKKTTLGNGVAAETTKVDTLEILSTEGLTNNLVKEQEDITARSTAVAEEKKAVSGNKLSAETTKVDTVESLSTEGTSLTKNLLKEQEDVATTKVDTVEILPTKETSLTNSLVQKQEDITTTSSAVDEEKTTVSQDVCSLVQKQEDITTTSTAVDEEKTTVSQDEVVIVSIDIDPVETLSTDATRHTHGPVQEQDDEISTGNILAEEDKVSDNKVTDAGTNTSTESVNHTNSQRQEENKKDVTSSIIADNKHSLVLEAKVAVSTANTCDIANQHTSGGSVVSSAVQASDIKTVTVATVKPQKQDEIETAKDTKATASSADDLIPPNRELQMVEGASDGISAPLREPDNNTSAAEEKVITTEHKAVPSSEISSVPEVEVARDVLSTIIEKIVSEKAVIHSSNDSTTGTDLSTELQRKEERSASGPGTDCNGERIGQNDISSSDAQVAAPETVSTESQVKEGRSGGGDDNAEKKAGQKDEGSLDTPVPDAQETRERSNCADVADQNAPQQGYEQNDCGSTDKSRETSTAEHSDQEDSQGLDNFMDSLSSSQLYQMEQEALTTAQQINTVRQEPDEGARKAILGLTSDLSSLNRSVMSVWREFNALQKKRLARKKEQAAKASRGHPNAFRNDSVTTKPVQNGRRGGNVRTQVAQPNPSPMKIRNDKKVVFSHIDQQKKTDQHNTRPMSLQATNNGQWGSNIRTQVAQQNPSPMKIRNNNKAVFNKLDQQKKMDQHKIRPTSLQAVKNRQQGRLLPMPKPMGKLPFTGTTTHRQPPRIPGPYQNTNASRGNQLVPPNRKPQNGSTPTKASSSSNSFNFTPTKPAQDFKSCS